MVGFLPEGQMAFDQELYCELAPYWGWTLFVSSQEYKPVL